MQSFRTWRAPGLSTLMRYGSLSSSHPHLRPECSRTTAAPLENRQGVAVARRRTCPTWERLHQPSLSMADKIDGSAANTGRLLQVRRPDARGGGKLPTEPQNGRPCSWPGRLYLAQKNGVGPMTSPPSGEAHNPWPGPQPWSVCGWTPAAEPAPLQNSHASSCMVCPSDLGRVTCGMCGKKHRLVLWGKKATRDAYRCRRKTPC